MIEDEDEDKDEDERIRANTVPALRSRGASRHLFLIGNSMAIVVLLSSP